MNCNKKKKSMTFDSVSLHPLVSLKKKKTLQFRFSFFVAPKLNEIVYVYVECKFHDRAPSVETER